MKKLSPNGVKTLKTCHLIFAMIWVVGVLAMAVVTMLSPQSGDELFMALTVNRFIDDVLVIPGATLTVVTAIIYGACTNWGFFKHRWITVKWVVSMVVIVVGTFYFSPLLDHCLALADQTRDAALSNGEVIRDLRITLVGAFVQAGVLFVLVVVSVFKPWKRSRKL